MRPANYLEHWQAAQRRLMPQEKDDTATSDDLIRTN